MQMEIRRCPLITAPPTGLLGSWAIAGDKGKGSKNIHVVYASPGTIEAYRKDGH